MNEFAADGIPVAVTCRVLNIARQPYYRRLPARSPTPTWPPRIEQTRCSTVTAMTRSSATGSWPTRLAPLENRWSSAPRGKSAVRWAGSARSAANKAGARNAGLARRCATTRCAVTSPSAARIGCGWPISPSTRTGEGKLHLCAIKDVWSNRIVGYSIDSRMKSRLALTAVHNAVARRGDVAGCVLHTDRGSQFAAGSSSAPSTGTT